MDVINITIMQYWLHERAIKYLNLLAIGLATDCKLSISYDDFIPKYHLFYLGSTISINCRNVNKPADCKIQNVNNPEKFSSKY